MKPEAALKFKAPIRMATALSVAVLLTLMGLGVPTSFALAQQSSPAKTTSDSTPNQGVGPSQIAAKLGAGSKITPATKPIWAELTPTQHKALKPLAAQWAQLSVDRKRKWLEISKNYESLSPTEQAKIHSRMSAWASLSMQERSEARLNFSDSKKLPADKKAAQWQSYQELSTEEKRKLAAQAPGKPAGVAVVKPTAQKKLVEVPVAPHAPQQGAKLAGFTQAVNPNTLLPQRPAPTDASVPSK